MGRDDLYITVPSYFKCPISLDVMKSPVSLSTGVTYERESIQRWLDGGNNTCPATMQVLPSKDLVPNRTLQRLIQIWSDHHPKPSRSDPSRMASLIQSLKAESSDLKENGVECLGKIMLFAEELEENCELLSKSEGLVAMLVEYFDDGVNVNLLEVVVRILSVLSVKLKEEQCWISKSILRKDFVSCVIRILQLKCAASRVAAIKMIQFVSVDAEVKLAIASNEQLMFELVNSIRVHDHKSFDFGLVETGLSCLISLATPKRVRSTLLHHNIISKLRHLLLAKNASVLCVERALRLLETVSCCKEGKEDMCSEGLVEAVVGKAFKVSKEATEAAVTILWGVCCLMRDRRAQEAVAKSNGMAKVLLIMQSNCSAPVRQMGAELLKVLRLVEASPGGGCLYSYDTKTTHIMPF